MKKHQLTAVFTLSAILLTLCPTPIFAEDSYNDNEFQEQNNSIDQSSDDLDEAEPSDNDMIVPLDEDLVDIDLTDGDNSEEDSDLLTFYSEDEPVIPSKEDMVIENGVLKGFNEAFVNKLSENQKKNVYLIIPNTVDSISDNAFSPYSSITATRQIKLIALAFEENSQITSIGTQAFYSQTGLRGDLTLPDSLTKLNKSSFMNCGFDGKLTLPENEKFTEIPQQAFDGCKFTGELEFPSNIEVIGYHSFSGNNFSGKLNIPEGVKEMKASAFSDCPKIESVSIPSTMNFTKEDNQNGHYFINCSSLTSVTFPAQSKVTHIYRETFSGTKLSGALILPDSVQEISVSAFPSTLNCLYLPENTKIANDGRALNTLLIFSSEEQYNREYGAVSSYSSKLTFPVEVELNFSGYEEKIEPIYRLYKQPYNLIQSSDFTWNVDNNYKLPQIGYLDKGYETAWYTKESFENKINAKEKCLSSTLYGRNEFEEAVVSFTNSFSDWYTGENLYFPVSATHSLAKPYESAEIGDYYFLYSLSLVENGTVIGGTTRYGYKPEDVFFLKNVSDTAEFPYYYYARIQLIQKSADKDKLIKTYYKTFYAVINPGAPVVNPVVTATSPDRMPDISLSNGDTEGKISWADTELKEGTNKYTWDFTPDSENYNKSSGTIELTVTDGKLQTFEVSFDSCGGTSINPINIMYGNYITTITNPEKAGYKFSGWYKDSLYKNIWEFDKDTVTSNITLYAMWSPIAETIIDRIENVNEDNVFDIKKEYDSLDMEEKSKISDEDLLPLLSELENNPNIKVDTSGLELSHKDELLLLNSISSNDSELIKDGAECIVKVKVTGSELSEDELSAAEAIIGEYSIGSVMDVSITKHIVQGDNINEENIYKLERPIRLVFDIPEYLYSVDRTFAVMRHHSTENGVTCDILYDIDNNSKTVTVSTDTFSSYSIIYNEKEKNNVSKSSSFSLENKPNIIEPNVTVEDINESHLCTAFNDINGHWGHSAICYVIENGLFSGISSSTFSPDDNMTRAMMWSILYRLNGGKDIGEIWYEPARNWAIKCGISDGTNPSDDISREQLVTILYRYSKYPSVSTAMEIHNTLKDFEDASEISEWAEEAVSWAVSNNIITGKTSNTLAPQDKATRAETAAILMHYLTL